MLIRVSASISFDHLYVAGYHSSSACSSTNICSCLGGVSARSSADICSCLGGISACSSADIRSCLRGVNTSAQYLHQAVAQAKSEHLYNIFLGAIDTSAQYLHQAVTQAKSEHLHNIFLATSQETRACTGCFTQIPL
jgi:hypothetical protein